MTKLRWFKITCIFLTVSFICMDLAWPHPSEHNAVNSTLSLPTSFQQRQIDSFLETFKSRASLILSMGDIGNYIFGEPAHDIKPLPIDKLEAAVTAPISGLSEALKDLKIEGICAIVTDRDNLRAIKPKESVPNDAVVAILCKDKGASENLVLIALKDNALAESFPGEVLGETDRYAVKLIRKIPKMKDGAATAVTVTMTATETKTPATRPSAEEMGAGQLDVKEPISGFWALIGRRFMGTMAAGILAFLVFAAEAISGQFGVPQQPTRVYTQAGDRRIFVQERKQDGTLGSPYAMVIKSVDWSPTSTNSNPFNGKARTYEYEKWYTNDIPLMAEMGVNMARLYVYAENAAQAKAVLDMFYQYGIKVIMPTTPSFKEPANLSGIPAIVNACKDHPAIFGWGIGNEWNDNYFYNRFTNLYDSARFTELSAQALASLDTNHPSITFLSEPNVPKVFRPSYHYPHPSDAPWFPTNGSINFISIVVNNWAPSVKVWGIQPYRGSSFHDLFSQWDTISTKPMFISEFGACSYKSPGEDQAFQRNVYISLWDEIYLNLATERKDGITSGASVFEWNDSWWKDGKPGIQNTAPGGMGGTGMDAQEWFGVLTATRQPKLAYYAFRERWVLDGQNGIPLATNPVLKITSGEASIFEINDKITYWRSGGELTGRGINIAILSETGTTMKEYRHFDTPYYRNDAAQKRAIADYLNAIPYGSIVVISVADHIGLYNSPIDEPVYQALEKMGSTQVRDATNLWTFIAKKGVGKYAETTTSPTTTVAVAIAPTRDADRRKMLDTPPAAIIVEGEKMANGNFRVTFPSRDTFVYKIEYRDDPHNGNWRFAFRGLIPDDTKTSWIDDGSFTGGTLPGKRSYRIIAIDRVSRPIYRKTEAPGKDTTQRMKASGAPSIIKTDASIADVSADIRVKKIFEIVENARTNNRATMVADTNKVIAAMQSNKSFLDKTDAAKIGSGATTMEIREKVENVIRTVESMAPGETSGDMASIVCSLKTDIDRLEADEIIGLTIAFARRAKKVKARKLALPENRNKKDEGQKFLLGIETGWIKEFERAGGSRPDGTNSLMEQIYSLGLTLRSMGLDNVEIVTEDNGADLRRALGNKCEASNTKWSNVIILASRETVEDKNIGFKALSEATDKDKPFIAGLDLSEFKKWADGPHRPDKRLDIQIMKFICLTLELASGKKDPKNPAILSYDEGKRMVIYMPGAEAFEYEVLRNMNKGRIAALVAA